LKLLCPGVPVKTTVVRKADVRWEAVPAEGELPSQQPELLDAEP
jgi:hypothetical protein